MIFFLLLISVLPLEQHRVWSHVVGELTVIKYLGALCLLFALLHIAMRRAVPRYFEAGQSLCFLALFLLATISYFTRSLRIEFEVSPWTSYVSFLLLLFITVSMVDTVSRLRWTALATLGSVTLASLYVIRSWQKYGDPRPGGTTGDANYFAISALVGVPLGIYLISERRPRWLPLYCIGCLGVSLIAIVLAASRGGFFGLAAGALFVVWRSRRRARNLVLAAVVLVPPLLALPISPIRRMLHPGTAEIISSRAHLAAWRAGLRMFATHPIIGVGLGNFKPLMMGYLPAGTYMDKPSIAHNTYIEFAAELGLPGLFLFLGILYFSYRSMGRVVARCRDSGPTLLSQVALGIQAGLIAYAVSAFFLSAEYEKLFWLVVFLSACVSALAGREPDKGGERQRYSASKLPAIRVLQPAVRRDDQVIVEKGSERHRRSIART
jgi:putative inorganic carbon (hco3(-)) transporter